MRQLDEIGICPQCDSEIYIYKTNNFKRFAKCEGGVDGESGIMVEHSYPLPKAGKIETSALICPENGYPVLIIQKANQKAYFWSDKPCFACKKFDICDLVNDLVTEFTEMKVYGY